MGHAITRGNPKDRISRPRITSNSCWGPILFNQQHVPLSTLLTLIWRVNKSDADGSLPSQTAFPLIFPFFCIFSENIILAITFPLFSPQYIPQNFKINFKTLLIKNFSLLTYLGLYGKIWHFLCSFNYSIILFPFFLIFFS